MVYIRIFLSKIRSANHVLNEKQKIALTLLWFVLVGLGMTIDKFLPFNYLLNTLRALIAILVGVFLFSSIYLFLVYRADKIKEKREFYKTLRSRFSYKERVNISVVLGGLWLLVLVAFVKENIFFTFSSSLLITSALGIATFVRSSRDETALAQMGLNDSRDLKFKMLREEEIKRRKEEKAKEDDK